MVIMNRKTFAESLSHHKCSVNFSYYHNDNGSSSVEKKKKNQRYFLGIVTYGRSAFFFLSFNF